MRSFARSWGGWGMISEYRLTKLREVLDFSNGRSSPDRSDALRIPVFGSNGLIGMANESNSQAETIIIGRVGSYCGSVHYSKEPCWITDNAIKATAKSNNSSKFLFYLLKNLNLNNWRSGSGQPLLNQATLNSIEAQIPAPAEQKEIARVIGSLDDRIRLLRETNATLEAMAQALFKSWFVDFDPVHAKQQGRAPEGMDAATAALFTESFEESELGMVPKEWRVSAVEEFAERVGMGPFGSNIKVETFVDSGVPIISGQHLKQTLVEDNKFNFITEEHAVKLEKSCVRSGDVIFTHAGSIGQVSLLHRDAAFDRYVLSQRQFFLRCRTELMNPEWIVLYFKSHEGQHQLLANTSQVGVPSIARPVSYLRSIKLVVPPAEVNHRFSSIAASINDRVMANRKQINTLGEIRDNLLPRLISGQLRLPEAQEQLESLDA